MLIDVCVRVLGDDLEFQVAATHYKKACVEQPARRARVAALSPPVCATATLLRAYWRPRAPAGVGRWRKFKPSWRENGYRSSPGRRHGLKTRRGARKKSVSPLRAFLSLRNALGMRTDAEKDVTTIEIGRDVLEAN